MEEKEKEKEEEKQKLSEIAMQSFSDEGSIKRYLRFIAYQLIDIKYELKELKDIEKHGV